MKKKFKPTETELEILQLVWKHEPVTVRYINDELNKIKRTGYTTTLKMMQIMTEKGMLQRTIDGRKHLYTAAAKEEQTQSDLLDKFVQAAFGGSAMKLVMQALGNHKTSQEELAQIKALIDEIEQEKEN